MKGLTFPKITALESLYSYSFGCRENINQRYFGRLKTYHHVSPWKRSYDLNSFSNNLSKSLSKYPCILSFLFWKQRKSDSFFLSCGYFCKDITLGIFSLVYYILNQTHLPCSGQLSYSHKQEGKSEHYIFQEHLFKIQGFQMKTSELM